MRGTRAGAAVGATGADRLRRAVACRSAGAVPGEGPLDRVVVRGGFEVAEGGLELGGVDDEGRAELVGRLAHLPEQGREDARGSLARTELRPCATADMIGEETPVGPRRCR